MDNTSASITMSIDSNLEDKVSSLVYVGIVVQSLLAVVLLLVIIGVVGFVLMLALLMKTLSKKHFDKDVKATMSQLKPKIAVLKLHGVILQEADTFGFQSQFLSFGTVKEKVDEVFALPNLARVVLNINSPGGVPVQTSRISSYITEMASRNNVSVTAFIEDVGASGGYWIACAASEIYADKSSIVGSIGVISKSFGLDKLMNKWGIERRVITAGDCKSTMDPFSPFDEEEAQRVQNVCNKMHKCFIEHVQGSRGDRLRGDEASLFNGNVWTGDQAVELGLIDGIDHMESYLARVAGDYEIVEIQKKSALSDLISKFMPSSSILTTPFRMNDYYDIV